MAKKNTQEVAKAMGVDIADYDYPLHLDLNSKKVPEVKDWKLDEKVTITLTGTVTRLSKNEYGEDNGVVTACLKVGSATEQEDDNDEDD